MAMNDKEVRAQLDRMVAFIKKEAEEKAGEIRDKAYEEYAIENQRLVQAEKLKIIKEYERKEKTVEVQRKIAHSNTINQNRLKVLKAREDAILKVYADAEKRLATLSTGPDYKNLLTQLILQAALRLKEPELLVKVREVDVALTKEVLPAVLKAYQEKFGISVNLAIASEHLPAPGGADKSSGGAILITPNGRISCNNTLDARLALAFEQRLHEVRHALFGRSPTRKYFE